MSFSFDGLKAYDCSIPQRGILRLMTSIGHYVTYILITL